MAIKVADPLPPLVEKDVTISHNDMLMIKEIKDKVGHLTAVRVTRKFADCGLKSAHDFVFSLK